MLKSLPAAFSRRSEAQRTKAYASPLRSLRPCWTAFLSILPVISTYLLPVDLAAQNLSFQHTTRVLRCDVRTLTGVA